MKLATKLILLCIGIQLTISAGIAAYIDLRGVEIMTAQTEVLLRDQTFHTLDKIERMFAERRADLRLAATDAVLADPAAGPARIAARLREVQRQSGRYASLSFFDMQRIRIADTEDKDIGKRHRRTEYWPDILAGREYSLVVSPSESLGGIAIYYAAAVKNRRGVPFGVVVARAPIASLYDIVGKAGGVSRHKEDLKIDLVDRLGLTIYSNYNPAGILRDTAPDWHWVAPLIADGRRTGERRHRHADGAEDYLVFVRQEGAAAFAGNDWTLILCTPAATAFAPVYRLRSQVFLLLLAAAFLVSGAAILFTRRLLGPVTAMNRAARAVGAGDFDVRLPAAGGDEIGQLSRAFNRMVEDLRRYREGEAGRREELETEVARRTEELREANAQLQAELAERRAAAAALRESNARFQSVADNIGAGIALLSPQLEILRMNRQMHAWFPHIDEGERPVCYRAFNNPPRTASCHYCPTLRTLQDGQVHEAVTETPVGKGIRHYRIVTSPIRDAAGEIAAVIEIVEDVTLQAEKRAALERAREDLEAEVARRTGELRAANQRLEQWSQNLERRNRKATILAGMGNFLQSCLTVAEAYQVAGDAAARLFPDEPGALFIYAAAVDRLEPAAAWGTWPAAPPAFAPGDCWSLRRGQVHKATNGKKHQMLYCPHAIPDDDAAGSLCVPMTIQGEVLGVLHLLLASPHASDEPDHEATEQLAVNVADQVALAVANLRLRESLENLSVRDYLTGLFNRRYLEETLEREIRRCERQETSLGLIMLDIDHFKRFNDTHGHAAGDAILRELGSFLARNVRASDVACRYGGEEFVLLLPDVNGDFAGQRAEYLRNEVKKLLVRQGDHPLGLVTLSCGVAIFPEHGKTADDVLRLADAALYRAKQAGRDQVCLAPADPAAAESGAAAPAAADPGAIS